LDAVAQLRRLLDRHDVVKWIRTRDVLIREGAVPHSHPVLTLNTRHVDDDDLALSTFLHEQLHWIVLDDQGALRKAIKDVQRLVPKIPVGHPEGANSRDASYLHVVVNFLEWRALREVVGSERAANVMEFMQSDHYTVIYALVVEHEEQIAAIIEAHGLAR
jgi:hypothetical protein